MALSFTALQVYRGCPRRYKLKYVKQAEPRYKEKPVAMTRGIEKHKEIAQALENKNIDGLPEIIRNVIRFDVPYFIEKKLMFDKYLYPTELDSECIILGFCDFAYIDSEILEVFDWKSGKTPGKFEQLKLYTLFFRETFSVKRLKSFYGNFIYFDIGKRVRKNITVSCLEDYKDNLIREIDRIQSDSYFVRNKSYMCNQCEYSLNCFFDGG